MLVSIKDRSAKTLNELNYILDTTQDTKDITVFSSSLDPLIFDILGSRGIFEFNYVYDNDSEKSLELLDAISYVFSELFNINWTVTIIKSPAKHPDFLYCRVPC